MTIQALQAEVEALPLDDRKRLAAFLVALRHKELAGYRAELAAKIDNKDPQNWVTGEEFEQRLES